MKTLGFLVVAACGSTGSSPAESSSATSLPSNTVTAAPASAKPGFAVREFVEQETGAKHAVWIGPDRDKNVDTNDPCCGLSYDGNRYDDKLASCAVKGDECGPGKTAVYPGLADDRVCGARRRCVPLPLARVIVSDATAVDARDADDQPLARGSDPSAVPHKPVIIGREGFINVRIADRAERVALDYGSRYTIVVRGGRVDRIDRD